MNRMDTDAIPKSIFNTQPERNRLRGRPRDRWWNCVQADLKKCKIFYWKTERIG